MPSDDSDIDLDDLSPISDIISRKWCPIILYRIISKGPLSFSGLKNSIDNISGKVLSENLQDLEQSDMIEKNVLSEEPKRVEYTVSSKGRDIEPILDEVIKWSEKHSGEKEFRILIVEDEKKLADIYQKWLSDQYEVIVANNGREALEKFDREMDLVLLDRMMPGISGEKVVESLRSYSDVLIVMLTAKDPETDIKDLEIDDYLIKPIDQTELENKVHEVISRTDNLDPQRELKALKAKKSVLEDKFPIEELEEDDNYLKIKQKIKEIEED